jgi:hypothetical protein
MISKNYSNRGGCEIFSKENVGNVSYVLKKKNVSKNVVPNYNDRDYEFSSL